MASHESYYTSTQSSVPASPISAAPPPPPPKPLPTSQDASRSATPPSNPAATTPGPPLPPHPSSQTYSSSSTPTPQPIQPQQVPIPVPPPSLQDHWLPSNIPSKSISDLQQLLGNPSLVSSLSQIHPSYDSSTIPLIRLLQSNIALSQQISALETQLHQLHDQTAQLLLNHTSLQTQWRRKQAEMDEALSPWGPRAMYQRLVSSITEQESLLRAMTESFLEGSGGEDGYGSGGQASEKEVADWVKRIRDGTAVLEKRREMRARWDEGRVGGWR